MIYKCDNCGHTADENDLPNAKDLMQRMTPGGIYTDRECSECEEGALCYPIDDYLSVWQKAAIDELRNIIALSESDDEFDHFSESFGLLFERARNLLAGQKTADTPTPIEVKMDLVDSSEEEGYEGTKLSTTIKFVDGFISIYPEGYGHCNMEDGKGFPIYIELYKDYLRVGLYTDINAENASVIDMDGARESLRKDDTK